MVLSPVRLERVKQGQTMFDIHRRTGINMARLSYIERRLVDPRPDEQDRIARALKMTPAELFPASTPGPDTSTPGEGAA